MSVREAVRRQCQAKVDLAASTPAGALQRPPEGWVATVRKALGISAAQLGRIVGRTRANISAAERSEQNDRVTLQTMHTLAEAMGCKFVYAIVPTQGGTEDVLHVQARKKARRIVSRASTHMALEKQGLPTSQIEDQVERLALDLLRDPPSDFWEDE